MAFRVLGLWLLLGQFAFAAVVGVEVRDRREVLHGRSFGSAGTYEKIQGKVFFEVDPRLEQNRTICDIDLAPRNRRGKVEFSSDFYLIRPTRPGKGNGTVLYEVCNRGRKGMLGMFSRATSSRNLTTPTEFGDALLLDHGFSLAWLGWQFDVPRDSKRLRLYAPVAKQGSAPIRGLVRAEFVPESKVRSFPLSDRNMEPAYPAVDPQDPDLKLTVRDLTDGPRQIVPRSRWRLAREENGKPVASSGHVFMASGFEPGRIYELVYSAENPPLVGLGLAATRDFIAFLKYGGAFQEGGSVRGLGSTVQRAIGFGTSQSGRFLRTFLYYGFNQEEGRRRVFDGVISHVAGASRGSFNHRFAQPSRDAHSFMNTFYPTVIYPFADLPQLDRERGLNQGVLDRSRRQESTPKIFYTNASYEYYGRAASLIHTSLDGARDVPLTGNTRVYVFAGTQHGPASFPPQKRSTANLPNPNDFRWPMRALLLALQAWLAEDRQPPPSQYPRISKGELVPLDRMNFPRIPGTRLPIRIMQPYRLDYGPDFRTKGIATLQPPRVGGAFKPLVPQVDRDGNEIAGIRLPVVQVPLATYTGWNLRHPDIGSPAELYSMVGSFVPFPGTMRERRQTGDPRLSIAERHSSREAYLRRIRTEADRLAKQRFLIGSDVPHLTRQAAELWDYLSRGQ